jgi:arylsulfatase A-like enzyme
MTRIPSTVAGALCALAAFAAVAPPARGQESPNIILIQTDDQDLELGSLEYMPYLQLLLAGGGTTFENAIVPLSLCCPSRATALTGQYAHNHQVFTNGPPTGGYQRFVELGLEGSTLPVALEAAGYRTVLLGKYLNGYPLEGNALHVPDGWTEWYSPILGNPYSNFNYVMNENGDPVPYQSDPEDYLTDVIAAKADDFIVRASQAGDPFFVYLAPYAPHWPATPAPRHELLFPGVQAPRTPSFNEEDVSDKPQFIRDLPPLTDEQIAALDDHHRIRLQSLQAIDEMLLGLVLTLQATGQLSNTYIVYTTDNGYHLGQHRLTAGKYYGYEKDLRVPLLVRGPNVTAGASVSAPASEVDLVPTIAELAGVTPPLNPDGRSLVPLFATPTTPSDWRQILFFEEYPLATQEPPDGEGGTPLEPPDADPVGVGLRFNGLKTTAYKYIEYDTGEREYYDLAADPDELENGYAQQDPAYLAQLSQTLETLAACAGTACLTTESLPIFAPAGQEVDAHPGVATSSNLNLLLEPGEVVRVEPSWRNTGAAAFALSAEAVSLTGPPGATYTLADATADYGSIAAGGSAGCGEATGDCYEMGVDDPSPRPAAHWDATFEEHLGTGTSSVRTVHVGESFSDVDAAHPFYRVVETLFHVEVTAGCGAALYCPGDSITRAQMAVYLLKGSLGSAYAPPPAVGVFSDVPANDPFAPWIEDLFARGITSGCGPGLYCPADPVTRETMAVLLLKTLEGSAYTPPPASGIFADVPAEDPYAPWIEDLFAREITAGCQAAPPLYCPEDPNTRGQMAAFVTLTFGLTM